MAIRCDDCRYLFSKKRVSCPFCGGQTIRDDRPDADLLAAGYTMAPQGRQQTIPDDPFEAMLRAYQQEPPRRQPTQPDPYEAELREIERQQRRLERQYRRAAFWDRLSSFRWGSVFRVVVFVLVVLAAIGLWNMRYTILNSVLDLVIGILPVVLLIWGIWLLIRSIFR